MDDRTSGFSIGQLVIALAGRETGCRFVVVGREQDRLLLVDGGKRLLNKPKRKNPTHVRSLGACLPGDCIRSDVSIRQALRAMEEEG